MTPQDINGKMLILRTLHGGGSVTYWHVVGFSSSGQTITLVNGHTKRKTLEPWSDVRTAITEGALYVQ